MKNYCRKNTVLISIVLFVLTSSFSQKQVCFQKIDMSDGLSYNSVLCVLQDQDQFLWVGTRNGLNKYNGLDNVVYKHDINDSTSLSHSHVNCIYQTKHNNIWVGTVNGLNRYNIEGNNYKQFLVASDSTGITNGYIRCIIEDSAGNLWIGTSYGLNKYNPTENYFEHIYISSPPTYKNNIISLLVDSKNRLWIGTKGGLYLKEEDAYIRIKLDPKYKNDDLFEIRDIKQDEQGRFWVATEHYGVYSFLYSDKKVNDIRVIHKENSTLISNSVRKLLIDDKMIWCATLKGVSQININGVLQNIVYSPDQPNGISNSSIHDIIKDHSGGYWLATYTGGLNYFHPQNNLFPLMQNVGGNPNSLVSGVITGFYEDDNNNVWISSGSGGLCYWNTKRHQFTTYNSGSNNSISDNNVKCLSGDANGNLWIGTYNGLNYFDVEKNKITNFYYELNSSNTLNNNQVHALCVDKNGLLWIGMNGGVFQVYDPATKQFRDVPGVGSIVNSIFEDSKGKIWIGERYGLRCIDVNTKKQINISHLTQNFEEQLNFINWISEDSSGRLWIGTQGYGIIVIHNDRVYWYNESNGLIDNTVNAILEDGSGFYWISTNKGISKIEYQNNNENIQKVITEDYSVANGLQGKQFEKGSALKLKSGNILFGGINGFNIVNPNKVTKMNYYPAVVLSEFKVHQDSGNDDKMESKGVVNASLINDIPSVKLNFSDRNFYIKFAGVDFINPTETFYKYSFNGTDNNWVDIEHQRTINFSYLPVGKHQLHIKASSNHDAWGDDYKSLEIIVLPPMWLTWWAFVIYGFIFLFLLYVFFHYSQKWANLKSLLSMEHFKREQELELHESKLRFFTDVSHELRTPLTLILAPLERIIIKKDMDEELNRQLLLIRRNGNRMMQLINQVLNLRRLETGHEKLLAAKGDFVPFVKEICLAFKEVGDAQNLKFEYHFHPDSIELWFDRDKMESVIFNLLSNAFKNSLKEGFVKLSVQIIKYGTNKTFSKFNESDQGVQIAISNYGNCIAEEDIKNIFNRFYSKKGEQEFSGAKGSGVGLELTKRMIKLHSGDIFVESKPESDLNIGQTTFFVHLPLGRSHLSEDEVILDFKSSESATLYTKNMQLREKITSIEPLESIDVLPKISDKDKQTLLIVEDNQEVRQFIQELFRDNYIVEEAENGVLGLEKATDMLPDLIISDVMMPVMDGIEMCRKLKTDIRTSHIPIVLLTARTTLSFKYEGIQTGADEYITKPFSAEYLMLRVKSLIKQRDLLRSYFSRQAILEPKDVTVTSVDERLLQKAVDYITENIQDSSISVEKLSKELGLSRVHFYRKIKALTNLTAVDFIRSIRLKRAASLLRTNKLNIKEVQNMVGFENADYFRKCFKSHFDMTPSEYAAKHEGSHE